MSTESEALAARIAALPREEVLEACYAETNQVYDETMAKNPRFKKIYETWKPFRNEEVLWFRVVENTLDNFMARLSAANKL